MGGPMNKILVIGSSGQIGSELVGELRKQYGANNVVATYHNTEPPQDLKEEGPVEYVDVLEEDTIVNAIEKHSIDSIYNLAAILSAKGEENPQLAFRVNVLGLYNTLELGLDHDIRRLVVPSSIGVFGPQTPKESTPNETILRPTSMYGITKVVGELLGNYYYHKFDLDVRGLRLPGIISYKTKPGGGTTDFAVEVFYKALTEGHYDFYVREDTTLPMMYMPDCIRSLIELAQADIESLEHHADFNVAGISFSAGELAREIENHFSNFTYEFHPDSRQEIADSWPDSLDDQPAREEWGWEPEYDLSQMTEDMLNHLAAKLDVTV